MAMTFVGSEGSKRSDIFSIDPTLVNMDETKNGRMFPVSDDAVTTMAESIARSGQQQPVTCRRLKDKSLELVSGFTRLKAIRLLYAKDPQWRIKVSIVELNDLESLMENIEENKHRNATTPLDDAFCMRKMLRDFSKSYSEIAAFYGVTEATVKRSLSLLVLPDRIQRKVASSELTTDAALKLAKLDESEIDDALAAAVNDDGHINGTEVARQVRERGVRVGHTVSELRKVLKDRNEPISLAILSYLKGDIGEVDLEEALDSCHPYAEV